MKRHINFILIFVAIATLAVAAIEYKHSRMSVKTNNDVASAILKRNAAMKTRIDDLKSTSSQLADAGGAVTNADVSAMLAAKIKADKEESARWNAKNKAEAKWLAERLKNDPEFALKRDASLRAKVDIKYAPFCRMQHLSQEQSEALADAEFKRMLRIDDMQMAQRLNEPDVDAEAITKEANDEFASSVKAVLGDDLYEQFSVYQRQGAAWDYVNAYGGLISLVDMSLSVEQASQLADAIASACPAFQKGKSVNISGVDWNAVDAAAVDFLTSEQMNFLKNLAIHGGGRPFDEWKYTTQKLAQ